MNWKPVIIQHSFGTLGTGGPIGALTRVMDSELQSRFDFIHVSQERPAGGINIQLLREMAHRIREAKPDLVHVRGLGNEGFHGVLAARMADAPRILLTVHGSQGDLVHGRGNPVRRTIVTRVLEPLTLRMSTQVATVCEEALRRKVLQPVSSKVLGVIPNGVDLVVPDAGLRARTRNELGVDDGEVVVAIVGRVVRDKGHFDLLDATRQVESMTGNRLHLLVVGDGADRADLERSAQGFKRTRVSFLGQRDNVPALLQGADVFVLPSLFEGMSNALLEAMASGLPVVASAVGGSTEVVSKGGGLLVPASSPSELAVALATLVEDGDLRSRLGTEAREVIRRNYTVGHMVSRLGEVYDQILR